MPVRNVQELPQCEVPVGANFDAVGVEIPLLRFFFRSNYCGGCFADFYNGCKKVTCG